MASAEDLLAFVNDGFDKWWRDSPYSGKVPPGAISAEALRNTAHASWIAASSFSLRNFPNGFGTLFPPPGSVVGPHAGGAALSDQPLLKLGPGGDYVNDVFAEDL